MPAGDAKPQGEKAEPNKSDPSAQPAQRSADSKPATGIAPVTPQESPASAQGGEKVK
jgi:hypothetical protein